MQSQKGNLRAVPALLAPLALLVLVAVTYREAPQNSFHLDDIPNIVRHPPVRIDGLTLDNLVAAARGAFLNSRPLPNISFAVDWWRGDGSAEKFQRTNVAIHAISAVAVFWLLLLVVSRLGSSPRVSALTAFSAAALWACHPIQVQAVTYIVQRMTSMAALFTVLAVILYVVGRSSPRPGGRWLWFALAVLCWILGLASKETAAIAPFLVLLAEYGWLRNGSPLIRRKVDWVLLVLPAIVAVLIVIDIGSGAGPLSRAFLPGYGNRTFTLSERLLTQPRVIVFHLTQILWPLPGRFSLEHDFATSSDLVTPRSTLFALLFVVAWCGLGVWALLQSRWRIAGALMLWVSATLVIESTFVPLEMVFEHRMYLPSVGLSGLVGLGLAHVLTRAERLRPLVFGACAVAIGLLILSTSRRVPDWRSPLSLAQASVRTSPGSARAWASLALAYRESGSGWDRVRPPMMKALAIDPNQTEALQLQVFWLLEQQRLVDAEVVLNRMSEVARRDHQFFNTLGMLRLEQRDYEAAVTYFEKALRINVSLPEVHYNIALAYELWGKCADAHREWVRYLQTDSNERRRAAVNRRLKNNFEAEGGRCYGWNRSR